jgi:phosphatidylserine decarboxylase
VAEGESPGVSARAFVALQYLLPQHLLSDIVRRVARVRTPWVKNLLIRTFVERFHPDMSEAAQPNPCGFPTFNEFFTRALRAGARVSDPDARAVLSPVDGAVSQLGPLDGSWLVQAKGLAYSLESLLEGADRWAARFRGGVFATLYLAPSNYHRVHMPLPGELRAAWYVPGQLFSVNAASAALVPGLFARNERVVYVFEDQGLEFALVLVGALFVGSMTTVWHGEVAPQAASGRLELPLSGCAAPLRIDKGVEMGRFNMGSTVILLLPPGRTSWIAGLAAGSSVRVGQALAQLT